MKTNLLMCLKIIRQTLTTRNIIFNGGYLLGVNITPIIYLVNWGFNNLHYFPEVYCETL